MSTIEYRVAGQGPAILLVHGGLSNGQLAWRELWDPLVADYRLVAVDRRGHGQSPRGSGPFTIEGDAVDLEAVADELGLDTFHVVGHSYGGLVALELCRRAASRLVTVHLIEPPYLALLPGDSSVAELDAEGRRIHGSAADPEHIAFDFLAMVAGNEFAERVRGGAVWPQLVSEAERYVVETYAGDYPPEALEGVAPDVPIQLYTGGKSHPALQKVTHALADRLPNSVLIEIPDAYHDVQRRADDFVAAFKHFTAQNAARRPSRL